MNDPDNDRPGSRGYHASPAPPSPRPSVASRASKSSLRREHERQELPAHPRPASVAYSRPHTPHAATAPVEEPPAVSSPPPPAQPPFSPLFTLLASTSHPSNRQTIQYPTVHYIFADDDPEILSAALAHHHGGGFRDSDSENGPNNPPDRAVLIDMERTPDGSGVEVVWASSLTPDWAVASARVSRTEGGDGGGGAAFGPGGNQVLKIEGVSIEPSSGVPGPQGAKKIPTPETELQSSGGSVGRQQQQLPAPAPEEYADLLQEFDKRMATLRKIVDAAGARQRALGDGDGHFSERMGTERVTASSRPETGSEDVQGRGGGRQ